MQRYGFSGQLLSTYLVRPDCLWEYPCASSPCVEGAECRERGFEQFDCICSNLPTRTNGSSGNLKDISLDQDGLISTSATQNARCVKPDFYMQQKLKNQISIQDIIRTEPIYVQEG